MVREVVVTNLHDLRIALLRLRGAKGWTQRKLGEVSGCWPSQIARWELGTTAPDIASILRVLEACNHELRVKVPDVAQQVIFDIRIRTHKDMGKCLRAARLTRKISQRKISQRELAELIDQRQTKISEWENDRFLPNTKSVIKVIEALGGYIYIRERNDEGRSGS